MLGDIGNNIDTSIPNTRYEVKNLGTWSSVEDVDTFLDACNHDTGYYGATIGSYVTINDGTYNKEWIIAGFDCEHNRTASDGSTYDNGYGICLIPKTSLGNTAWDDNDGNYFGGDSYNNSVINKTTLPTVATNLKKVLGNHLIERKVLLSSSTNDDYYANAYVWTIAYCTLMSAGQITGTFDSNSNKYDDGEANYKLPLFNYETWSFDKWAWLRGLNGRYYGSDNHYHYRIYGLTTSGKLDYMNCGSNYGLSPLIYIR